jgi:hypothetical protein
MTIFSPSPLRLIMESTCSVTFGTICDTMVIHDAGPAPDKPVIKAYAIYIQEESAKLKKEGREVTGKGGAMLKELGPKWKAMSATEKAPYDKKAKANKDKYKKELDAWKAKKYPK